MKVFIVDYGYGNLFSLTNALRYVGADVVVADSPKKIKNAEILFLPGVGAFGEAIKELRRRGFEEPLMRHAKERKPLFGICLGMQFLFDESEEFGKHKGLGLIPGVVKRMVLKNKEAKVPHVGWNGLLLPKGRKSWQGTIVESVTGKQYAYFVHSYVGLPKKKNDVLAEVLYGGSHVVAAVQRGALYGVQFHPEKSGEFGLALLANFLKKYSHAKS
ncbi:MAG: imidazole glycerol phosphate synthase, glutamine amidotransferase subunit [Candidatus Lloydbacteria bacterium RIFCSPHIGHO2_02_FULL_51_22]|uniref:Imidazole glycerol phosphate synthase subunit HisH n=2 Tax=Candidatus Lloydiibacteriota TaxID=1817910 RepID=A0A1G2DGN1_9BACT|nr:MAG: imidazole glycerol phosphate synthase, glutamine amidotransferase subunit [Candidatus Lloydbacteria bacterium RIFCSPHIGHO2_02_FULL_51_22]OGZ15159.1 MAG: imidazole glycerol phosphate synthase, glutamine amidotransferase subunit [Candidatus Lloydbacteria bacterium RIFCSPLOWO2_02_FULL_51_11]